MLTTIGAASAPGGALGAALAAQQTAGGAWGCNRLATALQISRSYADFFAAF